VKQQCYRGSNPLPSSITKKGNSFLTKYRLIVYYADEESYMQLLEIAQEYKISFTHIVEREALVFFIDDTDMLVTIARNIQAAFE
jgi:hypothetical protein